MYWEYFAEETYWGLVLIICSAEFLLFSLCPRYWSNYFQEILVVGESCACFILCSYFGVSGLSIFCSFIGVYARCTIAYSTLPFSPFNFMSPSSTIATHGFNELGLSGFSSSLGYNCPLWALCFHFTSTSTPLNIEGGECSSISPVYPVPSRMTYRRTLLLEPSVALLLRLVH